MVIRPEWEARGEPEVVPADESDYRVLRAVPALRDPKCEVLRSSEGFRERALQSRLGVPEESVLSDRFGCGERKDVRRGIRRCAPAARNHESAERFARRCLFFLDLKTRYFEGGTANRYRQSNVGVHRA